MSLWSFWSVNDLRGRTEMTLSGWTISLISSWYKEAAIRVIGYCQQYLTYVLQVFDVVAFSAHDLVDDVGPHLVSVLQWLADAQAAVAGVGVSVLHLADTLSWFCGCIFLVNPQLTAKKTQKAKKGRETHYLSKLWDLQRGIVLSPNSHWDKDWQTVVWLSSPCN